MKLTHALGLRFALATVALTGFFAGNAPAADRSALAAAAASITKEELSTHVDTLADDTFEGREAGSRGGRAAGNYLLKALEGYELKPAGDGQTYFQSFNGTCRNVLALLEGSDPELKSQVVQIGAHYDHVGYGRPTNSFGPYGYIHNGADDNASGVAGLLEIIGGVKKLPQPPRRSILFCFWDSEENGLIGSRHWLGRPTIPLDRIVFSINIDMIGRMKDSKLEVSGTRTSSGLRRMISEASPEHAAVLDFTWKMKADSDHWPFYERRIPVVMFHTGLHSEYHRPSDDAHLINHDGLRTSSQVALFTLLAVADAEVKPTFRQQSLRETVATQQQLEQPVATPAPRYGFPFKAVNAEGEPLSIELSGVNPGSPAEKAGLKTGDRLLSFQGQPIEDMQRFRLALLAASGETTFTVQREGEPEPLEIKVTPAGNPVRIGISWRLDEGEPGTAVVTQVTYASAAHAAGLALKDRIYSVAGHAFTTQEEFSRLLRESPSPIDLVIERAGKLQTLQLQVLSDGLPAAE
jgi:hypothetical protein